MTQTYEEWLHAVELIVYARTGLSIADHPFLPLYPLWENGTSPQDAAEAVIQEH